MKRREEEVTVHESASTQQRRDGFLSEMGVDGVAEELEDATILLTAGRDHGPDAFGPTLAA